MCGCLSHAPTKDLACNPGMCLDWESNHWPLGSQDGDQHGATPARAEKMGENLSRAFFFHFKIFKYFLKISRTDYLSLFEF